MGILKLSVRITLSCLGRIALFVCLTALLCFFAGLLGSSLLYGGKPSPVTVALVDEDGSFESRMLLNYLEDFEDYRGIIAFREETAQNARRLLEAGELNAVILIPSDFMAGIMNGGNLPFTITLNGELALTSSVIRLFADVYADMLRTGQIGVYAALDAAGNHGGVQYAEMFRLANMRFLDSMLGRADMLDERLLSPVGASAALYYGVSAFVFLLLLGSVLFLDAWAKAASRPVLLRLRVMGAGPIKTGLAYLAGASFPFAAVCILLGAGIWAANIYLRLGFSFSAELLIGVLLLILCAAAFLLAVSRVFGKNGGASVFVFIYSLVCLFLSGGIIPSAYLSVPLRVLGVFTPHLWLSRLLAQSLSETPGGSGIPAVCVFIACFSLAGLVGIGCGGRVGETL